MRLNEHFLFYQFVVYEDKSLSSPNHFVKCVFDSKHHNRGKRKVIYLATRDRGRVHQEEESSQEAVTAERMETLTTND